MANQTVYPFGPDGQLPSGYPIADDLNTNSAQQALSAKQGVVLKGMIEDSELVERAIDLSGLSLIAGNYISYSTNLWVAGSNTTKAFFVRITPGRRYRITAGANIARVAILSDKTDTVGTSPSYATGETEIRSVNAGTVLDFVAPYDANYLSINSLLSGTSIIPSSMVEVSPICDWVNDKVLGQPLDLYTGKLLIDARTESGTFGQIIYTSSLTDANWGVTGYIDTMGAKYMRFWATTGTTSNKIGGIAGTVFYDKDYTPLTDGVVVIPQTSVASGGNIDVPVPAGAKYMRTTLYYSASLEGSYRVYLWRRKLDAPPADDGGTYYEYGGERIVMNPTYGYRVEQIASNAVSGQSAAIHGNYLFIVKDKFTSVVLYDMQTKAQVYTWNTGQSVNTWHCNQSSFGTDKYDEDDMFPVLYVSMRPDSDSTRCIVNVYRIIPTLTDDVITSFTMTLVQTINLPALTEQNGLGLANATIDTENGWMWTYSRNTENGQSTSGLATFTKFSIPALFDGGGNAITTVTLEDSDIKDSFMERWSIYNNQGAFIHNGKMYMMRGIPSSDHFCECNVIDLYFQRTRVSRVDLYPNGFTSEPEGCFYYSDTVCFTVNGANIYRIVFN